MIPEVAGVDHEWGFGEAGLEWELGRADLEWEFEEADLEEVGEACPNDCEEAKAEQDPMGVGDFD